ncbi:Vacuolar protein sorting-associated protein atg6 [Elasticomyces elasticus]|nr:Vacuolar protein sorting-associated protein atg6 [Elasticomyces elasticus]
MYCQKCRTPLKLDGSLEELNPASFKILAEAAPLPHAIPSSAPASAQARERLQHYRDVSAQTHSPTFKRSISSSHARANPAMSFVMLTESQALPEEPAANKHSGTAGDSQHRDRSTSNGSNSLSHQMEMHARLFEVLSARSDIDHPICVECTELLLDGLQKKQASAVRERDAYVEFLKKAQANVPTEEEREKTRRKLAAAQEKEEVALGELVKLEREKEELEQELLRLDIEAQELDDEEEKFWRERNTYTATLSRFQEQRSSLQNQLQHESEQLASLQRANVYNDTFCISHDGSYGTINGLRLGRLSQGPPVDWAEIHSALGQVVLLLAVVSERLGFKLDGYRLLPMGSTSRIEKREYPAAAASAASLTTADATRSQKPKVTSYDLFSGADTVLGGFFHRGFDGAMVALLECLRQMGDHVERSSVAEEGKVHEMPYKVHKDRIGGFGIRLGAFGQEENWTKACKNLLTCCKFVLAHTSHVVDRRREREGGRYERR